MPDRLRKKKHHKDKRPAVAYGRLQDPFKRRNPTKKTGEAAQVNVAVEAPQAASPSAEADDNHDNVDDASFSFPLENAALHIRDNAADESFQIKNAEELHIRDNAAAESFEFDNAEELHSRDIPAGASPRSRTSPARTASTPAAPRRRSRSTRSPASTAGRRPTP